MLALAAARVSHHVLRGAGWGLLPFEKPSGERPPSGLSVAFMLRSELLEFNRMHRGYWTGDNGVLMLHVDKVKGRLIGPSFLKAAD
jgi:hypothetical protein